jgi:ubiquinone/menaquinone biosynthesis C-methylase UbiE
MSSRGEKQFINFPRFAAQLYDYMISGISTRAQTYEIAKYLTSKIEKGKLLDIGTGPGKLLVEINNLNPHIKLYGLDISESMLKIAEKNLSNIPIDLRLGNIRKTEYEDDFFDIITSTGSFYLWDYPIESIEEIHRLLKVNGLAYLFETYKEYNEQDFKRQLKSNLKKENFLRRYLSPYFLNRQLKMTYSISEIENILEKTSFKNSYEINIIKLGGLPIWLRISLNKTFN